MIRITIDNTQESNHLISDVTFIKNFNDLNEKDKQNFNKMYDCFNQIRSITEIAKMLDDISKVSSEFTESEMKEFFDLFSTILYNNTELASDLFSFIYNRLIIEENKLSTELIKFAKTEVVDEEFVGEPDCRIECEDNIEEYAEESDSSSTLLD